MNMKTLLEIYEEERDSAKASGDGFAYVYWSNRCQELISIMIVEEEKKKIEEGLDKGGERD